MEQDELYPDFILDEVLAPYKYGRLDSPTVSHCEEIQSCRDNVQMDLLIDAAGRVADSRFQGSGCAISQAGASFLLRHIEGRTVEELRSFQAKDMLSLMQIRLAPRRQNCALLPFRVLKTMVYSLENSADEGAR